MGAGIIYLFMFCRSKYATITSEYRIEIVAIDVTLDQNLARPSDKKYLNLNKLNFLNNNKHNNNIYRLPQNGLTGFKNSATCKQWQYLKLCMMLCKMLEVFCLL